MQTYYYFFFFYETLPSDPTFFINNAPHLILTKVILLQKNIQPHLIKGKQIQFMPLQPNGIKETDVNNGS